MSKLEELLQTFCPNGVLSCTFGQVVNYEQPSKYIVKNTDYNDDYETPVLTAGQTFILGYTNETKGIYNASKESPVIIFDDFTGAFKWVEFPFKIKSSAMKILTSDETKATLRYIYHMMGKIAFTSDEHKRLWIGTYSSFKLPLPPLPVQREIVRILDSFTELTAELTAELSARKKQYAYYRDTLFTFTSETVFKTLPEISENCDRQRRPIKKENRQAGVYPYYGASGVVDHVADYIFDGDYLLVSEDGANLLARSTPIAFSISGKNWVNNHAHVLKFTFAELQKYVEIYLNSIDLSKYISGGAQPKLNQDNLNRIPIPVPSDDEVKRIVGVLTRFDTLWNDQTSGLPAEIEARQKQYEDYRDKLLTFKEASV